MVRVDNRRLELECCHATDGSDDQGITKRLALDLRDARAEIDRLREYLGWLRIPMQAALRDARPTADAPPNVTVLWRTSSDGIAEILDTLAQTTDEGGE